MPRGGRRGEVRDDVCVDVARELGQAVLWHRFPITGDEINESLVLHIDAILLPDTAPRPSDAS